MDFRQTSTTVFADVVLQATPSGLISAQAQTRS
jgi:hypothetical protein